MRAFAVVQRLLGLAESEAGSALTLEASAADGQLGRDGHRRTARQSRSYAVNTTDGREWEEEKVEKEWLSIDGVDVTIH